MPTPLLGLDNNIRGHVPTQNALRAALSFLDTLLGYAALFASDVFTFSDVGNAAEEIVIGDVTYTLQTTLAAPYDVKIGGTAAATAASLTHAINGTGTAGTDYFAGTEEHPDVSAEVDSAAVTVTAKVAGADGNAIVATSDSIEGAWTGEGTLAGGADITDVREKLDALIAAVGGIEELTAANVVVTPAGAITETDVQAALEELDARIALLE
jgi:Tfp pilus assembly protein PilW